MTIAYKDWLLRLHPNEERGRVEMPAGYREMDDSRMDECFEALTEGENVWVWQRQGARSTEEYLAGHFRSVTAAGGVVSTPEGECLMIHRQGRWDLPKGMVEKGETTEQAALREVEEETGIRADRVGKLLTTTYHIYDKYGGWHLKATHWYAMGVDTKATPHPQVEEDIVEAVWVSAEECKRRLAASFASLRLVGEKLKAR